MSLRIGLLAFLGIFITSCEDTNSKKSVTSKINEIVVDTIQKSPVVPIPEKPDRPTLPFISRDQDSVIAFFKEYGANNPERKVRIYTNHGNIDLLLNTNAPLYRASFIWLVKHHYFDHTVFYRSVPGFIIQGGNSDKILSNQMRYDTGNYQLPPEYNNNLKHTYGTISASKDWEGNPEHWQSPFEFFILMQRAGYLDQEHTIFGRVTKGMHVVKEINAIPVDSEEWPVHDVTIRMEVLD